MPNWVLAWGVFCWLRQLCSLALEGVPGGPAPTGPGSAAGRPQTASYIPGRDGGTWPPG
jgi:hypothetical protein